MKRFHLLILFLVLILITPICRAQESFTVSDPRLELRGNIIHISYDILNGDQSNMYNISIDITDSNKNRIEARALSGDIGENVIGGQNRLITWDLRADNIFMDADIIIKIHAKAMLVPITTTATKEVLRDADQLREGPPEEGPPVKDPSLTETATDINVKGFSRTGIILQSLALPGLGLSRISGQPHWIRGVVGYGCIAGSILYNRKAISTYDDYLSKTTANDAMELYQSADQQDAISETLAYVAIGIWATDVIWTVIGSSGLTKNPVAGKTRGLSAGAGFDPFTGTPLMAIRFIF